MTATHNIARQASESEMNVFYDAIETVTLHEGRFYDTDDGYLLAYFHENTGWLTGEGVTFLRTK